MNDADISNYLYKESTRLEPRNAKQPLKFVSILSNSEIIIHFSIEIESYEITFANEFHFIVNCSRENGQICH